MQVPHRHFGSDEPSRPEGLPPKSSEAMLPPVRASATSENLDDLGPTLSPSDAAAVDALLASLAGDVASFPTDQSTSNPGGNLTKVADLFELIGRSDAALAAPPADLTSRTLDAIDESLNRRRFNLQIQTLATQPAGGFRWAELLTVAAVLLIGMSVVWPMMAQTRATARQVACQNNLATAGHGFAQYAGDFGVLPRGKSTPGTTWSAVGNAAKADGTIQSNSANLRILIRARYAAPQSLDCPENSDAPQVADIAAHDWADAKSVSYSYQNQFSAEPLKVDRIAGTAVLADKNPMFTIRRSADGKVTFIFHRDKPQTSASAFHGARGQNVLTADASVRWSASPVIRNGDNIWLATGIDTYTGDEALPNPDDSFLVP